MVRFRGGIDVPVVYGSRTTYLPGHLGGYEGRALRRGDILRCLAPAGESFKSRGIRLEDEYIPSFPRDNEVRVVFGLLQHLVTNLNEFSEVASELSTKDTRIGYRFYSEGFAYTWMRQERGKARHFGAGKDLCNTILIPYPVGSIQTDVKNGAIVVLQDAVSVGGYVTIGTVIQSDQDVLAQAKPGHLVKFIPISREQALSVRQEKREMLNRIMESCLYI
ncbi:hypothetical protein ACFLYF_04250 [Chloroflexota bacterium]